MAEVLGVKETVGALGRKLTLANGGRVVVGYTAPYAMIVHEDLETVRRAGREAKFLEKPLRYMHRTLVNRFADYLRRGMPVKVALLRIGQHLQLESMRLVPVDTGYLRMSAYTKLEGF